MGALATHKTHGRYSASAESMTQGELIINVLNRKQTTPPPAWILLLAVNTVSTRSLQDEITDE